MASNPKIDAIIARLIDADPEERRRALAGLGFLLDEGISPGSSLLQALRFCGNDADAGVAKAASALLRRCETSEESPSLPGTGAFAIAEAPDLSEELAFLDNLPPDECRSSNEGSFSEVEFGSEDEELFDEVNRLAEAVEDDGAGPPSRPFTVDVPSVAQESPPQEEGRDGRRKGEEEKEERGGGRRTSGTRLSTVEIPSALLMDPFARSKSLPSTAGAEVDDFVVAGADELAAVRSDDPVLAGSDDPAVVNALESTVAEGGVASADSPRDEAWIHRVRSAASRLLAPLIDRIHSVALEDDADLSATALHALGRIGYPPSVRVLKQAVASRPVVARVAVEALSRYQSLLAFDALKEVALFGPSIELRGEAAEAMAAFGEDECFDVWARLARSPEIFLRVKVCKGLARVEDERAEKLLMTMVTAPEPAVFIEVMKSLRSVGSRRCVSVLVDRFARHEDAHARATCLTTLLALAAPEGEELARAALKDPDARVRANGVEVLGRMSEEKTLLPILLPLLEDGNARVRANAAVALHRHDPREGARVIHKMLEHHQKSFRASAAWAAGRIGDSGCLERLLILLNTEFDKDVIAAALGVLDGIHAPSLGDRLGKLLSHPNPVIRMKAAAGYAASVDAQEARRELDARFRDEVDPKVRSSLIRSLQLVSTASEYGALKSKIIDSDERVVANAIEAMDALGVVEVASLVRGFLGHESPRVRVAAVLASWRMGRLDTLDTLRDMLDGGDGRERRAAVAAVGLLMQGITEEELDRHRFLADSLLAWKPAEVLEERSRAAEAPSADGAADEIHGGDRSQAFEERILELILAMRHRQDDPAREALEALLWEDEGVDFARLAAFRLKDRSEALTRLWEEKGKDLAQASLVERFATMEGFQGSDPRKLRLLLSIVETHLQRLGELVSRAKEAVELGEDFDPVIRILTFLKEALHLRPGLDGDLGATWFYAKDYDRAFSYLLKGLLKDPHDLNLLWKFARAAARRRRFRLAAMAAREIASESVVHVEVRKAANRFLEGLRHAGMDED